MKERFESGKGAVIVLENPVKRKNEMEVVCEQKQEN